MGRVAATELMPDFTGRTLGQGRLRLLESLGSGAYGKVYRATDVDTSAAQPKFYAVKCLNKPEPGSHTDILQQREFSAHKEVSPHPNIVTFHKHFSDDRFVYVVLDLCTGGDLFSAITEKRIFRNNGRLIKTAFVQLIDAVQYCHEQGIFHRDLKPENVLCSKDGTEVLLADFGLSLRGSVSHDFGCGSSYYMSPECIGREYMNSAGNYSMRQNDVWALGVILTNMVTGRNPWRYATSEDDCFSAYMRNNDFLQQVLPISGGVNLILKRIFTIDPKHRITLPTLRKEILKLKAFYNDDRDRTVSRGILTRNKSRESLKTAGIGKEAVDSSHTLVSSNDSLQHSEDSDERYIFASPILDHPLQPPNTKHPQLIFPDDIEAIHPVSNFANFVIGESSADSALAVPATQPQPPSGVSSGQSSVPSTGTGSSGSSGPESKGPVTPGTYATEPAIDIADIPEEEGLGQLVDVTDILLATKHLDPAPVTAKSKKAKHLFRTAFQRIRALSVANSS